MSDKTERSIICDGCGTQLVVFTDYPHRWGLTLASEDFNILDSNMVYAICCEPELEQSKHFCNIKCLKIWIDNFKKGEHCESKATISQYNDRFKE